MALIPQYNASGTTAMLHFFTGALDAAYMGSSPFVLGLAFDLPLRIVGVANAHRGTLGVVAAPYIDAAVTEPRIGTTLGSDGHVIAEFFANQRAEDITPMYVNLSPMECLDALRMGMLDYAALWDPYLSLARERGARLVLDDRSLPFRMYSFIATTSKVVASKFDILRDYVDAHHKAVSLVDEQAEALGPKLRLIFGDALSAKRYVGLLREGYEWIDFDPLRGEDLSPDIVASLSHVADAHTRLGTVGDVDLTSKKLVPDVCDDVVTKQETTLTLGYSNSIMCATFHVADLLGYFDAPSLSVQSTGRRLQERIARLDESLREDLRLCHELIDRDPGLVVQKIGRLNEGLFRDVLLTSEGERPRSIAAVLQRLEELKLVPSNVLGWADSVRSIRNRVTHNDAAIATEEAVTTFRLFLTIAEWHEENRERLSTAAKRCSKCQAELQEEWVACPRCGFQSAHSCRSCERAIEPDWKLCPYCGSEPGP